MKISGLIGNELEVLIEHLGNLDAVDKELVKVLISDYDVKSQLQGIGWEPSSHPLGKASWKDGRPRTTNKISQAIGQNSNLDSKELTVAEAVHALVEDMSVAGLIYKVDGKQVMLIKHDTFANKGAATTKKAGYKESNEYSWAITKSFLRELNAKNLKYPPVTSKKTVLSELGDTLKGIAAGRGKITSADAVATLFKTLAIRQWLLANPDAKSLAKEPALPKLEVIVIGVDKQRQQQRQARRELKTGIVPVPKTPMQQKMPNASYMTSSHNVYIRELASHLRYRLNQHKNKKAGEFETPADMLKHFLDEGYLKKLIYMGVPYNLSDNRIDFADLMLGPKGRENSYIEYKSETNLGWDDPRHKAVMADYKELKASLVSHAPPPPAWVREKIEKAESDEEKAKELNDWHESWAYDAAKPKMADLYLKHKIEPSKILVKLVLEGGKIIPHHFEMKYDRF
jgi:hypothetical protein